ncbi:hypothetical protein Tco_0937368 [Tanacetum coccineum]|uniref:Secreted protein n=1 Tax=Tanacetum coccineum TaxID=301880 RepID=A0ABQ5DG21_9ASTR
MVMVTARVASVVWMVAMMRLVVATTTVVVAMMVTFGVKGHGGVVDRDGDVVDIEMVSGCGGSSDKCGDDVDIAMMVWWVSFGGRQRVVVSTTVVESVEGNVTMVEMVDRGRSGPVERVLWWLADGGG